MDLQQIVGELMKMKIIKSIPTQVEQPTGGTVSKVYILDDTYVVKANCNQVTKAEYEFLQTYQTVTLLPRMLYVSPTYDYLVYLHIEGSIANESPAKRDVLKTVVVDLINHYTPNNDLRGWGWADAPTNTWQAFLLNEIVEAGILIGSRLKSNEHQFLRDLVQEMSFGANSYYIYGDLGFHNFIFFNKQLSGVIDPTPIIGEPLYDLIYAFCSTPEDLTKETFDDVVSFLRVGHKKDPYHLYGSVLIGLYLRLATCLKHHPKDIETYLKAWTYWRSIIDAYFD